MEPGGHPAACAAGAEAADGECAEGCEGACRSYSCGSRGQGRGYRGLRAIDQQAAVRLLLANRIEKKRVIAYRCWTCRIRPSRVN